MKEYSIRPKDLYKEYIRLSLIDAEAMGGGTIKTSCPGCGGGYSRETLRKYGFIYESCTQCDTLYCNPRPSLAELDAFYRDTESARFWNEELWPKVEEIRRVEIFSQRVDAILEYCERNKISFKNVLDIGSGNGIFLEEFRKKMPSLNYRALDPGSAAVAKCKDKGFDTYQTVAEEARKWHWWADLVICFEVIEHSHDANKFVQSINNLLTPNGVALITGLNYQGVDMRILQHKSTQVLPPLHLNFMSLSGYRSIFARNGFKRIDIFSPGKLDVNILSNALESSTITSDEAGPFITWLLQEASDDVRKMFQEYLSNSCMSSHIWIWAQK